MIASCQNCGAPLEANRERCPYCETPYRYPTVCQCAVQDRADRATAMVMQLLLQTECRKLETLRANQRQMEDSKNCIAALRPRWR